MRIVYILIALAFICTIGEVAVLCRLSRENARLEKENIRLEKENEYYEKDMVYGYKVNDVILMATLLRQNKITPIEARDFRTAFSQGVEYMQKIYENAMREQMRNILGESEVEK